MALQPHRGALLAAMLIVLGCSPATQEGFDEPLSRADVITRRQIEEANVRTAFEVIYKLQPSWLQTRVRSARFTVDPIRVYVDDTNRGDVEVLRSLYVDDIREMRHLEASEATTRFGTGHTSGAILVFTRRGIDQTGRDS